MIARTIITDGQIVMPSPTVACDFKRGDLVRFRSVGAQGMTPARAGTVVKICRTDTGPFVEIKIADTKQRIRVRPKLVTLQA